MRNLIPTHYTYRDGESSEGYSGAHISKNALSPVAQAIPWTFNALSTQPFATLHKKSIQKWLGFVHTAPEYV